MSKGMLGAAGWSVSTSYPFPSNEVGRGCMNFPPGLLRASLHRFATGLVGATRFHRFVPGHRAYGVWSQHYWGVSDSLFGKSPVSPNRRLCFLSHL
jgi:hypothetical protein